MLTALAIAGCAAAIPDDVPENLRGCWIERRGSETITMRWFLSGDASWRGERLSYREGAEPDRQTFLIDATAGEKERFGWALCPIDEALGHGPPRQPLYFGRGPDSNPERMEIDAAKDHLRFAYINGEQSLLLFDGARDGCD